MLDKKAFLGCITGWPRISAESKSEMEESAGGAEEFESEEETTTVGKSIATTGCGCSRIRLKILIPTKKA